MVDYATIIVSAVVSFVASLLTVQWKLRQGHLVRRQLEGLDDIRELSNGIRRELRRTVAEGTPRRPRGVWMPDDIQLIEPFLRALPKLTPRRRRIVRQRLETIFGRDLVDEVDLAKDPSGLWLGIPLRGVELEDYLYSRALQEPSGSSTLRELKKELSKLSRGR